MRHLVFLRVARCIERYLLLLPLLTSLAFSPSALGHELGDEDDDTLLDWIERDKIYDGRFNAIAVALPIAFGLNGSINIGIGASGVPYAAGFIPILFVSGDYSKKIYRLPLHDRDKFHLP